MSGARRAVKTAWGVRWKVYAPVLVVVLVVGLALRILNPHDGAASTAVATPTVATANTSKAPGRAAHHAAPAGTASNTSGCSLAPGSQALPLAGPAGVSWISEGGMETPVAASTLGPQKRLANGVAVCFAHSPAGALLAASNFFGEANVVPETALLTTLGAPGNGREAALAQAAGSVETLAQLTGGALVISGFTIESYEPASATLTLAFTSASGALVSCETTWVWQDSDWRLVVPDNGGLNAGVIQSLDGFTEWAAD